MAAIKSYKKTSKKKATKKRVTKATTASNLASPSVAPLDPNRGEVVVTGSRHKLANYRKADRGEFRGDFTRDTFDSQNKFSRVLMQQGRVQLDADWNEQNSIMLHHLRNFACDVGSEHWGPNHDPGFEITLGESDSGEPRISIGAGHYYVMGILCEAGLDENGEKYHYSNQPDYPIPDGQRIQDIEPLIVGGEVSALVYLDAWERHYTYVNDDSIREVALGGPDTATRAKIIWQAKILPIPFEANPTGGKAPHRIKASYRYFINLLDSEMKPGKGRLCAKLKDKSDDNDPCLIPPESRYRGVENQLYRVEIHRSGVAEGQTEDFDVPAATYKWSRENASVMFPIISIQDSIIALEHLGKDCRYGLKPNDWVELIDDDHVLQCRADSLFQVESVDEENRQVTLSNPSDAIIQINPDKHAYLRRWDHTGGDENGIAVVENSEGDMWLDLEDGIQVQFKGSNEAVLTDASGDIEITTIFKTGDYWLIPARTVTGDIEWPIYNEKPECLLPHGVIHHYAPLAILNKGGDGDDNIDLRRILMQTWT